MTIDRSWQCSACSSRMLSSRSAPCFSRRWNWAHPGGSSTDLNVAGGRQRLNQLMRSAFDSLDASRRGTLSRLSASSATMLQSGSPADSDHICSGFSQALTVVSHSSQPAANSRSLFWCDTVVPPAKGHLWLSHIFSSEYQMSPSLLSLLLLIKPSTDSSLRKQKCAFRTEQ